MSALTFLIFIILSYFTYSIRLINKQLHFQSEFNNKSKIMQQINTTITSLKQSLANNLNNIKNSNQDQRIIKLETIIQQLRIDQFIIYNRTFTISNNSTYCDNITNLLRTSANNLAQINQNLTNTPSEQIIKQIANPINTTDSSIQLLKNSINNNDETGKPQNLANSTNLLASGWFPANKLSQNDYLNKSNICPYNSPYVGSNGSCISCLYYDITLKNCVNCKSYDQINHICKDNNENNTLNPSNNSSLTNENNLVSTNTSNNQPITSQRVTNSNNLTGIILPINKSLEDYKSQLSLNPNKVNLLPCPIQTPFFNGTSCISCPQKQYFSSQKLTCQTCPEFQTYNSASFHCQKIKYYSNIANSSWVSVGTNPSDIIRNNQNLSQKNDYQSCPSITPFFTGQKCITCAQPTPIYSYDAKKCTSCVLPTIFDKNLHTCLNTINRQTNPNTAPNLIFSGRPLNQWNGYYFNNQTADKQKADCPTTVPYFDGATCITCPTDTPYFNLQFQICQNCKKEESYNAQSHQCLSVSGNIVSQEPSLLKMAATIFG